VKDLLNSHAILNLVEEYLLVTDYLDLEKQVQPCGFDLSLKEVRTFKGPGRVDFSNKERIIAETENLQTDDEGWFKLDPGSYTVVYNEVVKIPLDLVAIARPRSTMLRNGATVETAVWDPGYQGRSSSLLTVYNPRGLVLKRNARIAQLIFFRTQLLGTGYKGVFQRERME
jgi:dUTP pyrophosphatase